MFSSIKNNYQYLTRKCTKIYEDVKAAATIMSPIQ